MLSSGQYRLAQPKRRGKGLVGTRLYKSFMPDLDIPKKEWKGFREYKVFENSGRCWACGRIVGKEYLEIGHLVDKVCGGDSSWNNIRPMCIACNHFEKPLHDTLDEVYVWRHRVWHNARVFDQLERSGEIIEILTRLGGADA